MEVIKLSKYKLKNLVQVKLSRNVLATEAKIYYYPEKNKWNSEMKALKFFYTELDYGKVRNIDSLTQKKEELEKVEEFILPEKMIIYEDNYRGFTMPFIENVNLADLLKFKDLDYISKINYLKRVGEVLEKLEKLKKGNEKLANFALGDLHEANILVENKTGDIKVADLDSSYNGIYPAVAKNLYYNDNFLNLTNKYRFQDNGIIADSNTDLYCYYIMILNFFYGSNVARLDTNTYYYYLEYLKKIGTPIEFVDACSKLYTNQDNINPVEMVDDLVRIYGRANKNIFEANKGRLY